MLRVLAQGMRDLGLDPGPHPPGSTGRVATVSLDEKRQLVSAALAQGGITCLALLGRGLHRYADEPTHRALVSARDASDLFVRWSRLERYIHSRHRIDVLDVSDRSAHIAHRSRPGTPAPLPAENLVVLGVLLALLEGLGASRVSGRVGDVPVYPEPDPAALTMAAQQGTTAAWTIEWTPTTVLPRQPTPVDAAVAADVNPPHAWPALAQRSFVVLCANLTGPFTLPTLAQTLGHAPRSVQRSLSQAGLSYSQVLAEARCRSASWWLMRSAIPVAEVVYLCGHADQPHFTRDFRGRVGMTPLRYRSEFSARS
ncbi:MAG: helix-turn-helix transcriptional regulator [Chitinophagaceae bacterium]|nr:helix-turn-helix transcriptional regulator [Rubrivivax sp.]